MVLPNKGDFVLATHGSKSECISHMQKDYIQANTNGRLHSASEPSISPLNRGFLYGDAIYEVWRTFDGVVFAWDEHWQRLEKSASALFMKELFSRDYIFSEITRTCLAFRKASAYTGELYIRLQISRGCGAIGLDIALADKPEFVIIVQPCFGLSDEKRRTGLKLTVAKTLRRNPISALNPAWKTGNYLNNILCLREARAAGSDEVVILNERGEITEASVSNLAFVKDGVLITPPLEVGILAGITRSITLSLAVNLGIPVLERVVKPEELSAMQECMILSTTRVIVPVGLIDSISFKVSPDSVTEKLNQAFEIYMQSSARSHPELKVP